MRPEKKAGRGVLYIVWGEFDTKALARSQNSLFDVHPELPFHVVELPDQSTLLDKATMLELSPFAETLFLDADTVVLGDLTYGFTQARRFGLACSICECPWARRYGGLEGEVVEYNTGVLFFTERAWSVFDAWKRCAYEIDSSIIFHNGDELARMPLNDQAGFAKAVDDTGFCPFILPYNWNFRPKWHKSWFGPLKIWHDYGDVPEVLLKHNAEQSELNSIVRLSVLRD
ncbi:MAG: hypothetical protein CBB68_06300 [Rhodospirillaceae bacterium TMED8]|nr:hypothetical protein [Magnetovibrio sp.]OUT51231.1 MAG: hypothetical protein CBB68_06300 [Rhodospirillaceae bacterium TMED8]|tara:strand:+ start:237 stop:923 length:687 start_codon:yes stop_codon:yes gene_type:complete